MPPQPKIITALVPKRSVAQPENRQPIVSISVAPTLACSDSAAGIWNTFCR
ncbi:hypothetical protein D3C80_1868130 [compost metagenome]